MIINIDLFFLNDNETLCFVYNNENRLYTLFILNRQQLSGSVNGIRATIEVENMEIILTEDNNNISIDLRILDNEYISDEDFREFEQIHDRDWDNESEPISAVPISWYNDNYLEDTEDWFSD